MRKTAKWRAQLSLMTRDDKADCVLSTPGTQAVILFLTTAGRRRRRAGGRPARLTAPRPAHQLQGHGPPRTSPDAAPD